jgi:hypothetical protein
MTLDQRSVNHKDEASIAAFEQRASRISVAPDLIETGAESVTAK